MYTLKLKHKFSAAHYLKNYKGKCKNLHGHTWFVEIIVQADYLINDMLVDFMKLKRLVNKLDHKDLNDILKFNPTAENLAEYLQKRIKKLREGISVRVTIWESPNASITYESSNQ